MFGLKVDSLSQNWMFWQMDVKYCRNFCSSLDYQHDCHYLYIVLHVKIIITFYKISSTMHRIFQSLLKEWKVLLPTKNHQFTQARWSPRRQRCWVPMFLCRGSLLLALSLETKPSVIHRLDSCICLSGVTKSFRDSLFPWTNAKNVISLKS